VPYLSKFPAACTSKRHSQTNRLAYLSRHLRHLLKANGEEVKTVQELLLHANNKITLEVNTQAATSTMRAAQSKVLRMMVPNLGGTMDEIHPQKSG
jgi:hypothetical protein